MKKRKLSLAFDIGYASIGWAVLEHFGGNAHPRVAGAGAVTFPADDCLASKRRDFRRQRRNIRSTRQRIARLRKLLLHLGVLTEEELDQTGHPAPHWLAARALSGTQTLTWKELWDILRWYAHNRGYDGNRLWANDDEHSEDTEKEENALAAMAEHGTHSMAETICAVLGIDPKKSKFSSYKPFKTRNCAFPREIVVREVQEILDRHVSELPGIDQKFIDALLSPKADIQASFDISDLKLPHRYRGGLLFGQLTPRFENRVIKRCPITGQNPPNRHCQDFFRYRWARTVANIMVEGKPLWKEARQRLTERMEEHGSLTVTELENALAEIAGNACTNIEAFFKIHPDSKEALVIDPALALYHGRGDGSGRLKPYWKHLSEETKLTALNRWKKGRAVTLAWMLDASEADGTDTSALKEEIEKAYRTDRKKSRPHFTNRDRFLAQRFAPKQLSGRAPYSREVMQRVWDEAIEEGHDPTKPCRATNPDKGEDKELDGILYQSEERLQQEREKRVAEQTNNHLVRHRIEILEEKLLPELIAEYADGHETDFDRVVVEVNRDLKEFSGKTQKEIESEMRGRLRDFKAAVTHLEKNLPGTPLSGTLIRKCRIAMDLNWTCPYTSDHYGPEDLSYYEIEHIVPRSQRQTDALHALVLTSKAVNKHKGNRTALDYIRKFGGMTIPETSKTVLSEAAFRKLVDSLDTKGHPQDRRRKAKRKATLLIDNYQAAESPGGFTEGMLTQSSQLVRLACRRIESRLPHLVRDDESGKAMRKVISIPGQVTAKLRNEWNLTRSLENVCPEIIDENGETLPKADIRGLTHLHHALDAIVLGLIDSYVPRNGKIWRLLIKRRLSEDEQDELKNKCRIVQMGVDGKFRIRELTREVVDSVVSALSECRVMQHVPADRSGAKTELNPWRVVCVEEGSAILVQRQSFSIGEDGRRNWESKKLSATDEKLLKTSGRHLSRSQKNGVRTGKLKISRENVEKLLGLSPTDGSGKLKKLQAVLILNDNFGMALDPAPQIIPHHKVSERVAALQSKNNDRPIRVLRKGMLVYLPDSPPASKQDYTGIWRITSVKNNSSGPAVDMVRPAYINGKNGVEWAGMNKGIGSLLRSGLEILPKRYIGHPTDVN